ncbi:MAG: virulence protein SciE type [Gemmatimonadota bacterium]|nr:virulence protein SciE type [Gemmatimonadota bacterium]
MNAQALFREGKLQEAIESLGGELRSNPTDAQRRTFLFELLCFAGNHDRAEKQLDVLAQGGKQAALGTLLYRSALHADRIRQEMFRTGDFPQVTRAAPVRGSVNGQAFESLVDADPRIGARIEVFAAGQYMWLPLEHVATVRMQPPRRLRDLLWAPAVVRPGPAFKELELGELLLPVMAPLSWQHPDDAVRLGRVTEWTEVDGGQQAPVGQKLLLVDGEELPILELRELDITPSATPGH